jgi:hypothetical protein
MVTNIRAGDRITIVNRLSKLLLTAAAIASAVSPSLAKSTIRARQTNFCGVFRSRTSRSSRSRSAPPIKISSIFRIGTESRFRLMNFWERNRLRLFMFVLVGVVLFAFFANHDGVASAFVPTIHFHGHRPSRRRRIQGCQDQTRRD